MFDEKLGLRELRAEINDKAGFKATTMQPYRLLELRERHFPRIRQQDHERKLHLERVSRVEHSPHLDRLNELTQTLGSNGVVSFLASRTCSTVRSSQSCQGTLTTCVLFAANTDCNGMGVRSFSSAFGARVAIAPVHVSARTGHSTSPSACARRTRWRSSSTASRSTSLGMLILTSTG